MVSSTAKPKQKRLEWVDIAKGIAILLMVIGHELPMTSLIRMVIFSFHMPLFFILSGFTSRTVTSWTEIKRRVPRLLQIWCLAAIMIFLYELECVILQQTSFIQALHLSLLGIFWGSNIGSLVSPGVMWFLFVFAWAKFLFEVCQLIFKKNQFILGPLVLLSAYVAYLVSQHMWLPQAFDIVPIAILFMWFGYLLKTRNVNLN